MDPVITHVRKELKESADPQTQKNIPHFFKEDVRYYGVKVPTVVKIAKKYWKEVRTRDKKEIFSLCEELYKSGYCYSGKYYPKNPGGDNTWLIVAVVVVVGVAAASMGAILLK
jgi:hypothetical protein